MSHFREYCAINGKQRGKYSTLWLAGNKMKICSEDIMEVNMEMICNELYKDIVNEKADERLPFRVQSKLFLGLCIIFVYQIKHFINELEIKKSVIQQYDNEKNIQSGYANEKNTSRPGKKSAGRTRGSAFLNAASKLSPLLQKFKTLEDLINLSLSGKLPTTSDLNFKKEEENCAPVSSEDDEEETDVLIEEIPCTALMTPDEWPNLCGEVSLEDVNAFFTELGCIHGEASPPQCPEPKPEENLPEPSMMQDLSPPHPTVLLAMSTPEHPMPHAQIQKQSTELQHLTSLLLPLSPIPMLIDEQPDSHRVTDTAEEENMMVSLQKAKKSLIIIEETIAVEQKDMKLFPPPPTREWEKENIGYKSDDINKYSTLYGMLNRKLKLQKTNKCTDERSEAMEPEPEEGKSTNANMSHVEQAINPEQIEETRPYESVTEGASQSDEDENMLTENVIPEELHEGVGMNTSDQECWDIPQHGGEFGEAKKLERALLNRKEIYKWLERRVRFMLPDEEDKFQTMFPPGKNNRREAATAFFLLLRMDKDRIVVLKQEPSETGYGSLWIKKFKL